MSRSDGGKSKAIVREVMETINGMTCPRCGRGTLSAQTVVETLAVGSNAVQVTAEADVCSFCGERWFGPTASAIIDEAIGRLRAGDVSHMTSIGELYRAS
jgi:YgiT-type zinc finger domain-containing protein